MNLPESSLRLQAAIEQRSSSVLVLGLGAVGLAMVQVLLEAGYRVHAADTRSEPIEAVAAGRSPMAHIPAAWCEAMARHPKLRLQRVEPGARLVFAAEELPSIGVICVPTPLDAQGQPDLGPLESAAHTLGQSLAPECLVLLESTTYPGTTRNVLAPILREHGRSDASRVFVAFAPERVNPGHGDPAARGAPRLVGGLTPDATRLAQAFYQSLGYAVEVTARAEVAEAAKLVENVYRAVNISLVNELKLVFAAQGIDIWEVLDAAQTKGFGFQRFDPGPGAGGSCIPIDPRYLEYFARQGGVPAQLVELAGKIDAHMAEHVVHVLERAALQTGRALQGLRVLLLGVAYKPDVNITSESPSLRVAARLLRAGAQVSYCDPEVPGPLELAPGVWQTSRVLDAATMGSTDAMVYLTDHRAFALDTIAAFPGILVDTRGKRRLRDRAAHYVSA